MQTDQLPVFVYGTLQRGEERAPMWPRPPTLIEQAITRARLYDLGPYPAIADGTDFVRGELWHVAAEDMQVTLDALDEIECFGKDEVDLYVRRIVDCLTLDGKQCRAYTYFFAHPDDLAGRPVVGPDADGYCHWRRLVSRSRLLHDVVAPKFVRSKRRDE